MTRKKLKIESTQFTQIRKFTMLFNEIVDQFGHIIKDGWSKVSEDCYREKVKGGTHLYSRCTCCNDSCGKELLIQKSYFKKFNYLPFCSEECRAIILHQNQ